MDAPASARRTDRAGPYIHEAFMARRTRNRFATLAVQQLEGRITPVTSFKITSLTAANSATVEHSGVTGSAQGGIAASSSQLFVTGSAATGRFNLGNLSGATSVGARYDGLVSDLHTQKAYTLGRFDVFQNRVVPLDAGTAQFGTNAEYLMEINPSTGALTGTNIALSPAVFVKNDTGLFSGYDRILLAVPGGLTSTVSQIDLSPGSVGQVTTLNAAMTSAPHRSSSGWAYFGTAEHFGGQDYIGFAQDVTTVVRQKVSDGTVSTINAGFTNLADLSSFTVSLANNRWYFNHTGPSQFAAGARPSDQITGYADAAFEVGDFVVRNLNDTGADSLRDVIARANAAGPNQVVTFQSGLTGTINLSNAVAVTQPVDIMGPGSSAITVAGAHNLFAPTAGVGLIARGLSLSNSAAGGLSIGYPLTAAGDVAVTANNVSVSGPLTTSGAVSLSAGSGDVSFTNTSTLTVQGGRLTLTDGNTVDLGPTSTVFGTLAATNAAGFALAAGETLSGTGAITGPVNVAGTLGGTLTVTGNVTVPAGGAVSPGPGAATVTVNGNLVFQPGGLFRADFNGAGVNDRIAVNGTVDIGATGSILAPTFNYAPSPTHAFLLIDNDLADSLAGTLNGVRNRSGARLNNTYFQIRYDGGTGNDLELVTNSAPVLDPEAAPKFDPITENVPPNSNVGTTVDKLVGSSGLYTDAQGVRRSGLAFTASDGANGRWQYSRNGGTTWTDFGPLAARSATLLEADGAGQNRVRFQPALNYYGSATVSFQGWDTVDGVADGTTGADATVGGGNNPFSSVTVTAPIDVLAVNQPPVPVNDAYDATEDEPLVVAAAQGVLANDRDPDGPFPLTAKLFTGPAHGTITLTADGGFTYTPAPDYFGPDQFTYQVFDGHGASGVGVVDLTVKNDLADRLEVVPTAGTTVFTEAVPGPSAPVAVDPGIQIGTALEGVVTGAFVQITVRYVPKKDTLVFAPFATAAGTTIKGKFSPATGTLKLTGAAVPADYEAALRTVQYLNKSPAPVDGVRTITFQLQDAAGLGEPAAKRLQVVGVNTAPVLAISPTAKAANFRLGSNPVAVVGPLKVQDVDNSRLRGATVKITDGLQADDVLTAVTTKTGITATYANGVLTLTGNAPLKNYLKVLKSVKFSTLSGAGIVRTLGIQVDDGEGLNNLSNVITRTVEVKT